MNNNLLKSFQEFRFKFYSKYIALLIWKIQPIKIEITKKMKSSERETCDQIAKKIC